MRYTTASPEETERLGEGLGRLAQPGMVIAYTGDLGAGKTAFTRGLARGLASIWRGGCPCSTLTSIGCFLPTISTTSAGRTIPPGAASAPWSGASGRRNCGTRLPSG